MRSRESVYNEILSKSGLSLEVCEVMAFEFENEGRQMSFHYKVMRAGILIRLYDGMGRVARVVIDKGDKRARSQVEAFASEAGGKAI